MAVNTQHFSELIRKDVFTNKGLYCGKVLDIGVDLEKFRVKSIVVDAIRGSFFASMVGDKKGVIVPFPLVQAIGDILIVKHVTPNAVESETMDEKTMEKQIM
ncbi:MAG: PRC-barrel domain-containing protein [Candidatus Aenigmarchaeota archaeon]|nr:PRC-barrel domain-containing protein [Candidatus Aenigmarchaeota archaeon]